MIQSLPTSAIRGAPEFHTWTADPAQLLNVKLHVFATATDDCLEHGSNTTIQFRTMTSRCALRWFGVLLRSWQYFF
jgi:hypothetical protein